MRNHLNLTWTVGVLATMLLGGGCSSSPKEATENVITVHTVTISGTSFSSPYHYVGTLEEETGASISFKVQGNVQRIYVNEGQKVAKGALLAQVDTETLQQSYNAAKASYEQAEDAIRRMKLLYDNQSLSEVKYVEAQTNVEQSKSMYEIAKQNLKDARLVAPVAGVIGRKSIEVGENVMPGQTAFSLLDIRSVKVKIAVPEREMAHLPVHAEAQIEIPALSDARYSGKIIEKGVVADGATHTYEVKIRPG
ncbi:efflux RND transporter periplasmic adaptor subunit [Bacteroides sp. BFG-551]|nr:efflux RND transporter periplasmic adaptor subunit [Bacteroides sp. BFG-551]